MKTTKIILAVDAQAIKLAAIKLGIKVTITPQPKIVSGRHVTLTLEGCTDNLMLLGQQIEGLNANPHLFSDWRVGCAGRIKRMKRLFSSGMVTIDGEQVSPIQLKRRLIALGLNKSLDYILSGMINPKYPKGRNSSTCTIPGGDGQRITIFFA